MIKLIEEVAKWNDKHLKAWILFSEGIQKRRFVE
jgi:hypothetical protein